MTSPPTTDPAPIPSVTFSPIAGSQRIESLDVLRGFALLGILVVNTLFFALPMVPAMLPPWINLDGIGGSTSDWAAWWIVSVLFQYKFMSLFSILFGAGAAIQFDRARAAGRSFDWFFIRRLVVLFGFGLVHALVFWYGDILALYALIGIWLLILCRLSTKTLMIVGFLLLAFTAVVGGGLTVTQTLFAAPNPALEEIPTELPEGWLAAMLSANFDPHTPAWQMAEMRAYAEGPYTDLFAFRAVSWSFSLISGIFSYGWHILAMFAFGVAMVRSGFFGGGGGKLRCWAVAVALPIGLLLEGLCSLTTMLWVPEHLWLMGVIMAVREFSVLFTAFGYAALVTWIVRSGALSYLGYAIACVGRMALTVYLLQTVIMTSVFYYYGLGLFGEVDRIWLLVMAILVWIGLVVFSTLWLSVFSRGPFEWFWRLLSYMRTPRSG